MFWSPDGRTIFYLTAQPGRLTFRDDLGPPLSIASVDAAGGSPSIVVRDVQAFDVGFPD